MVQIMLVNGIVPFGAGKYIPEFLRKSGSSSGMHDLVYLQPLQVGGDSRFFGHLASHLPEVAARIDLEDLGFLHLEVGALKLASREAIARRDWYTAGKHFVFVANMMDYAGADLLDAIRVSYLGNLFYDEASLNYAMARSLLPKSLLMALGEVERHYGEIKP